MTATIGNFFGGKANLTESQNYKINNKLASSIPWVEK